jgi:hypothetical protein
LYKKQMAEAAKVACEEAKEVTEKKRDEKVARLAAARVEEQHYREAENKQKTLQLFQRGKRAASQEATSKAKRACGAVEVPRGAEVGEAAAAALPKLSTRGCEIKKPCKFE